MHYFFTKNTLGESTDSAAVVSSSPALARAQRGSNEKQRGATPLYETLRLGDGGQDLLCARSSLHSCPRFPVTTIAASSRTSTPTSLFRVATAQADPWNGIPSSHWCFPAWPRRLQLAGVPPPALQAEEFERSGGTINNSGAQIL